MAHFIKSIAFFFGIGDNPLTEKHKSDADNIRSDWYRVGADIYNSACRYENNAR